MSRSIDVRSRVACSIALLTWAWLAQFGTAAAWGQDGYAATRYAAIALNDCTGAYGYTYNHTDRAEAEWAAIRRAGRDSRIVLSTTARYFALAQAPLGGWGTGVADTASEAREQALANARKHSLLPTIRFCEYNGPRN
jgi:hypothetical protein